MRRLVIVKGGARNFQLLGCCDRASIRTRLTPLGTWCSMKFDLAALLSLSRPLWAGRGLAVAANSVCPCMVVIPDPSPDTTWLPRARPSFRGPPGGSFLLSLSLLPVCGVLPIGPEPSRPCAARRSEPLTARTDLEPYEPEGKGIRCSYRSASAHFSSIPGNGVGEGAR